MDVIESLSSLSAYPVPRRTLTDIAEWAGLPEDAVADKDTRGGAAYRRAAARVYIFLSEAPDVSQGGISYSFTDEGRRRLRRKAEAILASLPGDDAEGAELPPFGYMGGDL